MGSYHPHEDQMARLPRVDEPVVPDDLDEPRETVSFPLDTDVQPDDATLALHTEDVTAVFAPLPAAYGTMRIHHQTSAQIESAVHHATVELNTAFQRATVGDQIRSEHERLRDSVAFTNVIKIPKGKRYADELVHKIALQMVEQAQGEATARAVNYLSSAELVKQFLSNTTGGFQVILAILRDCKIKVPLEISFDPKTRKLDRRYLDFTDGDSYTIDDIVKGLIYLNTVYGSNSRRTAELESTNVRLNELNHSLRTQQEALVTQYNAMHTEFERLQKIERLYQQVIIEPLQDTERQFVLYRTYEVEAKLTRRQRREQKHIEKLKREFLRDVPNERLRQSAYMPNVDVMALEHEPRTLTRGAWIGLTDADDRRGADANELDSSRYEMVTRIGEALKLSSFEEADAILRRMVHDFREAKKRGRKSLYKGPKNPHRYAVFQIVMRKA